MAETIKKDAIAWAEGEAEAKTKKSWNDFSSESNFYTPVVGAKITLKNAGFKKSTTAQFPVFEVYEGNKFMGYISFRKVQGLKYIEVRLSRDKKEYAKFQVMNLWDAPEGTTFGAESLKKALEGKKIQIVSKHEQEIPAYDTDLTVRADKIKMSPDTYFIMNFA